MSYNHILSGGFQTLARTSGVGLPEYTIWLRLVRKPVSETVNSFIYLFSQIWFQLMLYFALTSIHWKAFREREKEYNESTNKYL